MSLARTITRASRSNFAPSFLFLPKDQRKAIETVYAFSRLIDDAVDRATSPQEAREQLGDWREALTDPGSPHAAHPIILSLAPVVDRYEIPRDLFLELITGVEMDLSVTRYPTFSDLYEYCYKVASIIGLICIRIFECRTQQSRDHAIAQGLAFQLTNILRDVASDFGRGRIYIPREDMERFGYTEDMLAGRIRNAAFREMMAFEADRAETYYRRARETIHPDDRRALVASEIMADIYHKILTEIRNSDYDVFSRRIGLKPSQKLRIALKGWVVNRFSTG